MKSVSQSSYIVHLKHGEYASSVHMQIHVHTHSDTLYVHVHVDAFLNVITVHVLIVKLSYWQLS